MNAGIRKAAPVAEAIWHCQNVMRLDIPFVKLGSPLSSELELFSVNLQNIRYLEKIEILLNSYSVEPFLVYRSIIHSLTSLE